MVLGAQLALSKSLIDIFTMLDTYEEAPARQRVLRLVGGLASDDDVSALGPAYSEALVVLASDLPRWRSAADIALRLDLHEALPGLIATLSKQRDPHVLAVAAALSQTPAVAAKQRQAVSRLVEGHHGLIDPLQRMLSLRLDAGLEARTDLEGALKAQIWPGSVDRGLLRRVGPLVYMAEQGSDPVIFWRVAAAVAGAGARLRRVPAVWRQQVPAVWFSPHYPVVAWSGAASAALRQHFDGINPNLVLAPDDMSSALWAPRLLHHLAVSGSRRRSFAEHGRVDNRGDSCLRAGDAQPGCIRCGRNVLPRGGDSAHSTQASPGCIDAVQRGCAPMVVRQIGDVAHRSSLQKPRRADACGTAHGVGPIGGSGRGESGPPRGHRCARRGLHRAGW